MPTPIKQGVHFLLEANLAQLQLLVRHLKVHRPFAVPSPLPPPTLVPVPRRAVHHCALALGKFGFPVTRVCVAVGVFHRAVARFLAGGEVARVRVAVHVNVDAVAVRVAPREGHVKVTGTEVELEVTILAPDGVEGGG